MAENEYFLISFCKGSLVARTTPSHSTPSYPRPETVLDSEETQHKVHDDLRVSLTPYYDRRIANSPIVTDCQRAWRSDCRATGLSDEEWTGRSPSTPRTARLLVGLPTKLEYDKRECYFTRKRFLDLHKTVLTSSGITTSRQETHYKVALLAHLLHTFAQQDVKVPYASK